MGGFGVGSGSCRLQGQMGDVGGKAYPLESSLLAGNWDSDGWGFQGLG